MAKRGLMAATVISMLILTYSTGYAESVSMTSDDINHCPAGWTEERCQACAKARADRKCENAANQCFYKLTVTEVTDQDNLKVTYPPSVWNETGWEKAPEPEKRPELEEQYKAKYESYAPYTIRLRPTDKPRPVERDKTYVFSRCPEDEFTLGSEIDPNETGMPRGPEQSNAQTRSK
jgi:hypothetical protein